MIPAKHKFDAETVISDFLGDLYDGHERVGKLDSCEYAKLRRLAKVLISDLKESDLAITSTQSGGAAK